jgi:hypothetical protein
MMNNAVRFWGAMSAVAFAGCSSNTHGSTLGTGGHSGGSQGNGGTTVSGSGGTRATGGTLGSGGTFGSGGTPGSTGTGGAGGQGGTSAVSDAGAFHDATPAMDAAACPVCPAMKCTYGSPVDGHGCIVCTCNPAPDGGVDVPTGSACALPEGCADAGSDAGAHGEAGGRSDLRQGDAVGIQCGTAVCGTGEYCCNPVTDLCAPIGAFCAT